MDALLETLNHTADGACIVDARQRIVFWNGAAEQLLGYQAAEVLGRACFQVFGGRGEEGCLLCRRHCQPFTAASRSEPVTDFDVRVRHRDGEFLWVNVSILSAPAGAEAERAIVHLFRPVGAQKQLEQFARDIVDQARQLGVGRGGPAPVAAGQLLVEQLTPRELQVLALLARGVDTAAIARQLVISQVTVRNHIQRILSKLGVHSRLEAVAQARERGWV